MSLQMPMHAKYESKYNDGQPPHSRREEDPESHAMLASSAPENSIYFPVKKAPKLFIGGISPATSQESLRNYFEQFGDLIDCTIMVDKNTNKGRGFGFVTYRDHQTANFVVTLVHIIDGKKVDCKKAKPRKTVVDPMAADPTFKTSKIFVGGLPLELTTELLSEYFMNYGDVVDCVIVTDKDTRQSRGFGFVQFSTCAAVQKVMNDYYNIKINGKWVECKKALPKDACSEIIKTTGKSRAPGSSVDKQGNLNSLPMPADLYQAAEEKENMHLGTGNYYSMDLSGQYQGMDIYGANAEYLGASMQPQMSYQKPGAYMMQHSMMAKMEPNYYKDEYAGYAIEGPDLSNYQSNYLQQTAMLPNKLRTISKPDHAAGKIEPKLENNKLDYQPF